MRVRRDRRGLEILVGDTLLNDRDDTVVVTEVDGYRYMPADTERAWTILKRADGASPDPGWLEKLREPVTWTRQRGGRAPPGARPWWKFWG
jgi:LmbE family N-acetylglucosaminyl deacetylase